MSTHIKQYDTQQHHQSMLFILAVVLYSLLYLLPLSSHPLLLPDETRYAEIPREMLATGDWIVPHLNGLRYFEKPPFGYWVNALSIAVYGENTFAVRLPGIVAVGLTAWLIYRFVRKTYGDPKKALLSAIIYLTFGGVYFIGEIAVLDNLLALFLTGGFISYSLAAQENDRAKTIGYWSASGAFFGLGFMTKGFIALAIPVLVIVPWMIWQGFWRPLLTHSGWVFLSTLAVILPWSILIDLREDDFWHYFFWVEHVKRFFADNAQHKESFYFFLLYLPLLGIPWINLLPAAIAGLRIKSGNFNKQSVTALLWSWLILTFVFFSVSKGKLLTYILPCFPPLAIVLALGLSSYLQRERTRLFEFGILLNVILLLGAFIILLATQYSDFSDPAYNQNEHGKLIAVLLALILGVIGGLVAFLSRRANLRLGGGLFIILPLLFVSPWIIPSRVLEHKGPGPFLTQYRNLITDDTVLVSSGTIIRAVNWYFKRDDVYLFNSNELDYGLSYPEASGRLLDPQTLAILLEKNRARFPVAIFCRKGCPKPIKQRFPPKIKQYSYGVFTLWYVPRQAFDEDQTRMHD